MVFLVLLVAVNMAVWIPVITSPGTPEPPPAGPVYVPDFDALIQVTKRDDVTRIRGSILTAVFGSESLPPIMPQDVRNVEIGRFGEVAAEELTIPLTSGEEQRANYFTPSTPNNRLAIYHAGHQQDALIHGDEIVRALIAAGFHVLSFSMVPDPHDRYEKMERPLEPLVEHVLAGLNYALFTTKFETVIMVGLSGGGWTTVLYAAIDTRIKQSFPVAGSYPFYLREQQPKSRGDFEQELPGLSIGYLDLYLLASTEGRQQIQIFNEYDPCCFSGRLSETYRDFVAERAASFGGEFDVYIDPVHEHVVSANALELILSLAAN